MKTILLILLAVLVAMQVTAEQMIFVPNEGQWHERVQYRSAFSSYTIDLLEDRIVFCIGGDPSGLHGDTKPVLWEMRLLGASPVTIEGSSLQETKFHFYIGNDRSKWKTNLQGYQRIRYANVWEGVDLLVYSNSKGFKYDFIVQPGADPSQIKWKYTGVQPHLNDDGSIFIASSGGINIEEAVPFIYQEKNGTLNEIEGAFTQTEDAFGFRLGEYDTAQKLVLDPEVVWSTYGAKHSSRTSAMKRESDILWLDEYVLPSSVLYESEFLYAGGAFQLEDTNTSPLNRNSLITSLTQNGDNINWVIFLGGNGMTYPYDLKVLNNEEIMVYGLTNSTDFPISFNAYDSIIDDPDNPTYAECFITIFNPTGTEVINSTYAPDLPWQTQQFLNIENEMILYLGGGFSQLSVVQLQDGFVFGGSAASISTELANTIYGDTEMLTIHIFKMNQDLSTIEWYTALSPEITSVFPNELHFGCVLKDMKLVQNELILSGFTTDPVSFLSSDAIDDTLEGPSEGLLVKLSPDEGTVIDATYLGGPGIDELWSILPYEDGFAFAGTTTEGGWPSEERFNYGDGRIIIGEVNAELSELTWYGRIGFEPTDTTNSIPYAHYLPVMFGSNTCGKLVIGLHGAIGSSGVGLPDILPNFEAPSNWLRSSGTTFFGMVNFDKSGLERWGYYGGSTTHGFNTVFKNDDNPLFTVCCEGYWPVDSSEGGFPTDLNPSYPSYIEGTLGTLRPNWPADSTYFQINHTRFDFSLGQSGLLTAEATVESISADCSSASFSVTANDAQYYDWFWEGESLTNDGGNLNLEVDSSGTYSGYVIATDSSRCNVRDTAFFSVDVVIPESELQASLLIPEWNPCDGPQLYQAEVEHTGADLINWQFADGYEASGNVLSFEVNEPGDFLYTVSVTDTLCDTTVVFSESFELYPTLNAELLTSVQPQPGICEPALIDAVVEGIAIDRYEWSLNGSVQDAEEQIIAQLSPGENILSVLVTDTLCQTSVLLSEAFEEPFPDQLTEVRIPNVFTPQNDGINDAFRIAHNLDSGDIEQFSFSVYNRWGALIFESDNPLFRWQPTDESLSEGTYFYKIEYKLTCSDEVRTEQGTLSLLR
jgi:gliding motility-associated-like protein